MIVGIGVDIVDVPRFGTQLEKGSGLLERLFTESERPLPLRSLAARFAAKEAISKALGAPAGLNWQHCTIVKDEAGAPQVSLCGTVLERAEAMGITNWHLSLSHDGDMAIAMVVAER
ncbi:holo-ACP synthase [Glutamicibacter sp. PS]|uniref:holo-ACP synthase n=1 Tax=Glutamicibacter sp. PS TaxID=3075634 RepID=UPI00284005F8|nr:holo-ACP synthase [Glutamicibacter sp. PS]MDR4532240.1 holo-ACP synthase [Glutamicibacter sp. PS]